MGEVEAANPVIPSKATVAPQLVDASPDTTLEIEGFSWLQKGLFFLVVFACVFAYLRVNTKKDKRYLEKSMA